MTTEHPFRRIAARACGTRSFRHSVRRVRLPRRFPVAGPLPSIPSARDGAGRHGSSRLLTPLFGDFSGTMGPSDFPRSCIVGVRPKTSRRGLPGNPGRANAGPPGSRARCFRTCTGSPTARGPVVPRDSGTPDVAFRISLQRRHPGGRCLSRLNTRPVRTPVNASRTPLRTPTHDSGPSWAANPSTYDSFIHYTSPV